MVIQQKGIEFQSKNGIIDEIISENPASTIAPRTVSRGKQMPEVRSIIERKATDNISLYRSNRSQVASPNGASISALRGPIGKSTVQRRTLSIGAGSQAKHKVT